MANSKVAAFLDAVKANEKAKEFLAGKQPQNEEEKIEAYVALAKDLGYELTAADFSAFIAEAEQDRKAGTAAAAAEVEVLPDDDLGTVAGGAKGHSKCQDTYQNKENCWYTDGCDNFFVYYDEYLCSWHNLDKQIDYCGVNQY